jgi:prevent-host-death family protein
MKTVGLKLLKNKLSEYVRCAAAGETIVITDRGRPVAEINPPRQVPDRYKDHPVLARGIREGWITPAVRGPDWPPKGKPVPGLTLDELLADLDEARKDAWC